MVEKADFEVRLRFRNRYGTGDQSFNVHRKSSNFSTSEKFEHIIYTMTYQLSMIECSACGNHLGHLYEDYYSFTKTLMEDIRLNGGKPKLSDSYVTSDGRDITAYLRTYYTWAQKGENQRKDMYYPANLVARALLSICPLEEKDLPYSVEEDGQRGVFEPRICCLRMFQADPGMICQF